MKARLLIVALAPFALAAGGPPLSFEPNVGQAPADVRYVARPARQLAFFTSNGVVLQVRSNATQASVQMTFGGERKLLPEAEDQLSGRVNYLNRAKPSAQHSNIPTYSRIRYRDAYPGIDVVFYGNEGELEYDLVLRPGADLAKLRLLFDGAESIAIDGAGDLLLATPAGDVRQRKPIAYQLMREGRRNVETTYLLQGKRVVGVRAHGYDKSRPLVIDPVIGFSTFLGGTGLEDGRAIAVDQQGNVYIAGTTGSADFPVTAGVPKPSYTAGQTPGDVFVTKLDRDGTTLRYSTFIGGTRTDVGTAIAVDSTGAAYIGGYTHSLDFPVTVGAYQLSNRSFGSFPEGFVTKLNPEGSSIVYATYLGQVSTDRVSGIAVDTSGSAYVAGSTDSTNFPTTFGAFRTTCSTEGLHGFVTKLNPGGATQTYSTLLCGSANDEILAIAVDGAGSAYVTGNTTSTDFPTTLGALRRQSAGDGNEAFVAKLDPAGGALSYGTYLGGALADVATGVTVDQQGQAYISGYTRSIDFPTTTGAWQVRHADRGLFEDAFISVLSPSGTALVSSSYLGGSANDRASGIAISGGNIYVAGVTSSPDFPGSRGRCQPGYSGGQDAFVAKLDSRLTSLTYTSLLGGWGNDAARSIAVDLGGTAYVAGQTASRNFSTTTGAYRTAYGAGYGGASDAFAARIDDRVGATGPCIALNGILSGASFLPGPVSPGLIVSVFGEGLGPSQPAVFSAPGSAGILATSLSGVRLLFDGVPAPMILASAGQVNAIVPYEVSGKQSVRVQVEYQGVTTPEVVIPVSAARASIFSQNSSGQGAGAILNQDYSLNTPANGAAKGSIIQIFATGEGQTNPAGINGKVTEGVLPKPVLGVTVTVGGIPAPVQYAGAAPGLVQGLLQVNAQVPANAPSGTSVPIILTIGETTSPPGTTVAVR